MKWHARISRKPLIIAAACARPFVQAAAAGGHSTIAADVFCDEDTRRVALCALPLGYRDGGFAADDVRTRLFPLLKSAAGFLYGSGFETQPRLLAEIAVRGRLLGNAPETVAAVKDPRCFFPLLARLGIPFPETRFDPPRDLNGWLAKLIGGSGGIHVTPGVDAEGSPRRYYQRQINGRPVSLLFLADGRGAEPVGYNLQLLAPGPDTPFRFGGAVSRMKLPGKVCEAMQEVASKLTAEYGLRGLNSLDCLVDGGDFQVLEVNPRLSATFALYDARHAGARLLEAHIAACEGRLTEALPPEPAQAHLIYYAASDITIPADMTWPKWSADLPPAAVRVPAGAPLCTVMAAGESTEAALALAEQRNAALTQLINDFEPTKVEN